MSAHLKSPIPTIMSLNTARSSPPMPIVPKQWFQKQDSPPCACGSKRFMSVSAHCRDTCEVELDGAKYSGYVPPRINMGEGSGDSICFDICAECGRIPGLWPLPRRAQFLEANDISEDEDSVYEESDEEHDPQKEFNRLIIGEHPNTEEIKLSSITDEGNPDPLDRQCEHIHSTGSHKGKQCSRLAMVSSQFCFTCRIKLDIDE